MQPAPPALDLHEVHTRSKHGEDKELPALSPVDSLTEVGVAEHDSPGQDKEAEHAGSSEPVEVRDARLTCVVRTLTSNQDNSHEIVKSAVMPRPTAQLSDARSQTAPTEQSRPSNLLWTATLNMGFLPRLRRRGTAKEHWDPSQRASVQWDLTRSIPLKDLLPMLSFVHRAFFEKLDREQEKVDSFYLEKEKEMRVK